MDKYNHTIVISREELLQIFFDRIEEMGEWDYDPDVPKGDVTEYKNGCVEITRRLLELFERPAEPEENWTPCDGCEHLTECLVDGDLVNIANEGCKGHHFKPTSLYKCPEGRYPGHTLQEQNELREQLKKEDPCYECPGYDYLNPDDCKECDHYERRKEKAKEEE